MLQSSHNFQHSLPSQLPNQTFELLAIINMKATQQAMSLKAGISVHQNANHIISTRVSGKKPQQPSLILCVKKTGIETFQTMLYM